MPTRNARSSSMIRMRAVSGIESSSRCSLDERATVSSAPTGAADARSNARSARPPRPFRPDPPSYARRGGNRFAAIDEPSRPARTGGRDATSGIPLHLRGPSTGSLRPVPLRSGRGCKLQFRNEIPRRSPSPAQFAGEGRGRGARPLAGETVRSAHSALRTPHSALLQSAAIAASRAGVLARAEASRNRGVQRLTGQAHGKAAAGAAACSPRRCARGGRG